jgi:hypothetical protein
MIGLPPSARGLTGRPADVLQHATQLAREWEDVAEDFVPSRMRELGIPDHQIGAPDYDRGGLRHAFLPNERRGGTNDFAGRLYVDSGVLNPELNAQAIGPEASALTRRCRNPIGFHIPNSRFERVDPAPDVSSSFGIWNPESGIQELKG